MDQILVSFVHQWLTITSGKLLNFSNPQGKICKNKYSFSLYMEVNAFGEEKALEEHKINVAGFHLFPFCLCLAGRRHLSFCDK